MMQVTVPYGSNEKNYKLSPFTEENTKCMVRRSYKALSYLFWNRNVKKNFFVSKLMIEEIKKKTKHICSTMHNATTSN